MPDPLPKPPGRPPGEPIIIKHPPPPPDVPEVDGSLDEEDNPEIKRPPEIMPEMPPPPAPWDRADRLRTARRCSLRLGDLRADLPTCPRFCNHQLELL